MLFLRCHRLLASRQALVSIFLLLATSVWADDVWSGPAFAVSPEALRQAAAAVKADKDADATILLNDDRFTFDHDGKLVESYNSIMLW